MLTEKEKKKAVLFIATKSKKSKNVSLLNSYPIQLMPTEVDTSTTRTSYLLSLGEVNRKMVFLMRPPSSAYGTWRDKALDPFRLLIGTL